MHGKGGIDQIWLVYNQQLNREVALKELRPERSRNTDVWPRFLREAQITGQLQHPNIVFYTTKLVQVRTLRDAITMHDEQRKVGCAGTVSVVKTKPCRFITMPPRREWVRTSRSNGALC